MKNIGDLVRWKEGDRPLAIVLETSPWGESIRVSWLDTPLPIQASATSVSGNRVTTWLNESKFEVVSHSNQEEKD